jgi:thiamine transport system ATP-binding protein
VCELLGIDALLRTPIATLSGGEAQRVALARALVLDPDVLFLDEPTASLDSEARSDLRADLERVARQRATSILLITHDRNEAFHLADRIAVLRDGRLVQTGSPTDLKITVRVSQNSSRVIGSPSNDFKSRRGMAGYTQQREAALRADLDVAAGRVLDRRHLCGADGARGHLLGVEALQPLPPVGPP